MKITTAFKMGQRVTHILNEEAPVGVIIAFMLRGKNHSYQVQWTPTSEPTWHLDFELKPHTQLPPIAFAVSLGPEGG